MDFQKIIDANGFSDFPIGLGGCRNSNYYFDSCDYDIFVFDNKKEPAKIIKHGDLFLKIHHAHLSETNSKNLLQYYNLHILQDDSWDLKILISKIREKYSQLHIDFANNCLIESLFCCQKTRDAINADDVFAPCWQKCASYFLAESISSLNNLNSSPSHMLDLLRNLNKNTFANNISTVTQTLGIERTTPTLLSRMVKSTIGFSDLIENNGNSKIIQKKFDFFLKNSMLSDCYFYLGFINKENFIKIKDIINNKSELIFIIKVAFDVESDSNLLLHNVDLIQDSCVSLLGPSMTK